MTGMLSRHVVIIGAIFLIVCGHVPKFGAVISSMPIAGTRWWCYREVRYGSFSMLSDVVWNRRNMMIFAIALSVGLGLQLEPGALQHLPKTLTVLMSSGLLPAAFFVSIECLSRNSMQQWRPKCVMCAQLHALA